MRGRIILKALKRSVLICTAVLVFLLCISDNSGRKTSAAETGKVTFMVYMIGSDLESKASAGCCDLDEIAGSGVDLSKTDVLVCAGGTKQWHRDDLSPDADTVLHLTSKGFEAVKDFDVQSMGEPDSLSRFLDFCCGSYPADTYYLVLWDHGNGPLLGYGKDTLYKNDALTLSELGTALSDSPFGKDNKLGFIGFDACLMSSAELLSVTADYADYLIASQETEPANGWDYSFLKDCGKLTDEELAKEVVDSYHDFYEKEYADKAAEAENITLSVIDLSASAQLEQTVEACFAGMIPDLAEKYDELALSRVKARALGRATTGSEYDLVDLESLLDETAGIYPEQTKAAKEALDSAVVYNRCTDDTCCGVSIYYPFYNKQYYEKKWRDVYSGLGVYEDYFSYLESYSEIWLADDESALEELGEPEKTGDNAYSLTLTDEQAATIADTGYYILRKEGVDLYRAVYVSKQTVVEGNTVRADFDGNIIYYEDPNEGKLVLCLRETDSYGDKVEYSPPVIRLEGNDSLIDWQPASMNLTLNKKTGKVTFHGIYEVDEEDAAEETSENTEEVIRSGKQKPADPGEFPYVLLFDFPLKYLTRDDSGKITDYSQWPDNGTVSAWEPLTGDVKKFVFEPIYDDGYEYYMMIRMMDTHGNTTVSELLPITLSQKPEDVIETEEFTWESDSQIVFEDSSGIVLSVLAQNDPMNGLRYFLQAENRNGFSVTANLSSMYCDTYNLGSTYFRLEPGQIQKQEISKLNDLLFFTNSIDFSELTFFYYIMNTEQGKTLLPPRKAKITCSSRETGSPDEAILGAKAEEQPLCTDGDLEYSLLSFGKKPESYADLGNAYLMVCKIHNNGAQPLPIGYDSLFINGSYIRDISVSDFSGNATVVPPGGTKIFSFGVNAKGLFDVGITSIGSVTVGINTASGFRRCELDLSLAGDAIIPQPQGEALYSDNDIEIYYTGADPTPFDINDPFSKDDVKCGFLIKNKAASAIHLADVYELSINGEPVEYPSVNFMPQIMPTGENGYFSFSFDASAAPAELSFGLVYWDEEHMTVDEASYSTNVENIKTDIISVTAEVTE